MVKQPRILIHYKCKHFQMLLDKDDARGCPFLSDHPLRVPITVLAPTLRPSGHATLHQGAPSVPTATLCYYFIFSPKREFLLFFLKNEARSSGRQAVRHHVRGSSPLPRLKRLQGPCPMSKNTLFIHQR